MTKLAIRRSLSINITDHLIQFIRFLHNSDDEEFARMIAERFNVDSFLEYLAVNVVLVNLDSYLGVGHNYLVD